MELNALVSILKSTWRIFGEVNDLGKQGDLPGYTGTRDDDVLSGPSSSPDAGRLLAE